MARVTAWEIGNPNKYNRKKKISGKQKKSERNAEAKK
jgi:hypothetical protein